MNYRNVQFNHLGTIDCELEHPDYGWIPFTANPEDVEQLGRDLYAEIKARHEDPNDAFVAEEYVAPPLPDVVSIHQYDFVEWCKTNDKLDALETLISSSAENRLKWSAAVNLKVDDPLVVSLAPSLGITDLQATFNEIG